MGNKVFTETNVLLKPDKFHFEDYEKVYLSIVTIEELDGLKKSEEIGHLARQATRNIREAKNKEILYSYSESTKDILGQFLDHKNDNNILAMAYEAYMKDNELIFFTDDYNLLLKAEALKIPCRMLEQKDDEVYKGYKTFKGGTYEINELFGNIENGLNDLGLLTNEYLMIYNHDIDKVTEHRFDGRRLVDLKLPSSKIIKGKNTQQRFALDLLMNKDIPIKIIAGGFGSGKTLLSVKTGLCQVNDTETYKSLTFIRNPIVADGAEIGFLPGDKSEKIQDFCRPFLQYIEDPRNPHYAEDLIHDEKIRMDVVSFLKGVSIDDSFVIMDEAEDLNVKLLKLVGSRVGAKSAICFTGDWKQSESRYQYNNGLLKLIDESKGNPLVGVVVLEEDVRSEASKVFANL